MCVCVFQMVLDDSAQMRRALQGFSSVLTEMGSVFDVSPLEEQLSNADRRVADMQHSLLGPLSQLEHAAAVSTQTFKYNLKLNYLMYS